MPASRLCHSAVVSSATHPTTDPPGDRPTYPLANLLELPNGAVAEWEAIGNGPPLLWIEGGPGLPAHLARPDVGLVADRFRAHLVHAPGCGRSSPPRPPEGWDLDSHVQYFDGVRRALDLGRITVMGHSWGGLAALALALAVPDAVERVIVIDGYAGQASVPEDIASAETERAFDRIRNEPWFEAARAAFGADCETPRFAVPLPGRTPANQSCVFRARPMQDMDAVELRFLEHVLVRNEERPQL